MEPDTTRSRLSRPVSAGLFAMRYSARHEALNGTPGASPTGVERRRVGSVEAAAGAAPADEYVPDLVLIVRADGTVLYANRALGTLSAEDVIGANVFDWVFPDQQDALRTAVARVFETQQSQGCELAGLEHHDADAWYDCRIAPNLRDGNVVSATLIVRDITRHKRAELELIEQHRALQTLLEERAEDLARMKARLAESTRERETSAASNSLFRTLLDAAGEAVFISDPVTGLLIDINETACRWLRRERGTLVGQPVADLALAFPVLPPESGTLELTETRDTRRPLMLAGVHRRSDGSTFPIEIAVAQHAIGDEEYVLAVVRDVKGRHCAEDALRTSDARYQALFEQSWDAIFVTTRGGEIVEANRAAVELFGYARDELVGLDARVLLDRKDDVRAFQRAMGEHGVVDHLDVEVRLADGGTLAAVASATRRLNGDGRLLGYQWIVRARDAAAQAAPAAAPAAAETPPAEQEPPARPRETVLLVDENAIAREELAQSLAQGGLTVVQAADAHEALEVYREHEADIGVTVLGAEPQDQGVARTIEALRRVQPDAPVVLVTADDPLALGPAVAHLGVRAFLRKPPHPLALVQAVREALVPPSA